MHKIEPTPYLSGSSFVLVNEGTKHSKRGVRTETWKVQSIAQPTSRSSLDERLVEISKLRMTEVLMTNSLREFTLS